MLKDLNKGTVLVDVAVDQGGCFETTKPTTHNSPTYIIDDILHYSVANMPGAVPMTSTEALTNATIGYAIEIANKGWKSACIDNAPLMKGLNIINGKIVYKAVETLLAEIHAFSITAITTLEFKENPSLRETPDCEN